MEPKDYQYVCDPCADAARKVAGLTYAAVDIRIYTSHTACCDCCGRVAAVAHVRNFDRPWSHVPYWRHWT